MSRLLHLLALLALMLAPAAMHRADAAAPHHEATATAGHCSGDEQSPADGEPGRGADCALACSAMPGAGAELGTSPLPDIAYAAAPAAFFAGTAPGSDPPPPRAA